MGRTGFAVAAALFASVEGARVNRRSCGSKGSKGLSSAIVNGENATECEWKWQAGLRVKSGEFRCGGMLVDPEWIVTAAHCMYGEFEVVVGAHKVWDEENTNWQVRATVGAYNHPDWIRGNNDYDFALLRLESPVDLDGCVGTICLPTSKIAEGSTCWITGFGKLNSVGRRPEFLQEAAVKILSNLDCGGGKFNYTPSEITDRMLCAQGITSSGEITDSCRGDSGGPLVCEVGGVWFLHGVRSWGRGCAGAADYPGVYARITDQLDWIEETMANPPSPTPAPTPPGPGCPSFSIGPDVNGDCLCWPGLCYINGSTTPNCPTSEAVGDWGGKFFLAGCQDCQCFREEHN